jgi:hypothetical protein
MKDYLYSKGFQSLVMEGRQIATPTFDFPPDRTGRITFSPSPLYNALASAAITGG